MSKPMTPKELDRHLFFAVRDGSVESLSEGAKAAAQFLRTRLSEAAYHGQCHHCDEVKPGEPCHWCGLVRASR
jgi:hypothetical protein